MKKIITLAAVLLLTTISIAQTTVKGFVLSVKSGNWSDPTVWSTGFVPDSTWDVAITGGYTVTIDNLNISSFGLSIDSGNVLNAMPGGEIALFGNWSQNGSFNSNASTVNFKGAGNRYVSARYDAPTFENLQINGPDTVFFYTDAKIAGELKLDNGVMDMTSYTLTLLSDANRTSRIAPISLTADLIGIVKVQRYIQNNSAGWKFFGSAVDGASVADLKDDVNTFGFPNATVPSYSFCSVNHYYEPASGSSSQGYINVSDCNEPLASKNGYRVWMDTGVYTIDVTGTPLKFNQNFNVSYNSDNTAPSEDGWCLVANPYASAIDWNSTYWTKTNMDDAVYVWNPATQQYAAYINGVSTNGGSNIISSSQAFFVRANQNSPALSCNENIKVNNNPLFLRTGNPNNVTNTIKLTLSNGIYSDETLINFAPNATGNFDGKEDALKLTSLNTKAPNINTVEGLMNLSVNTMPLGSNNLDIPVRIQAGVPGTYTIQSGINTLLRLYTSVILEDLKTNTKMEFNNGAAYIFTISDTAAVSRFILHLSSPVLNSGFESVSTLKTAAQTTHSITENKVKFKLFPNPNSGEFTVDISGLENNHEIALSLSDEKGVVVYNSYFNTQDESSIQRKIVLESRLNNGIYFCKINIQGAEQTLKVIVN